MRGPTIPASVDAKADGEHGRGGSTRAMYATVRRYEGVTDPSEAGRLVDEGFIPLYPSSAKSQGSWLTIGLTLGAG